MSYYRIKVVEDGNNVAHLAFSVAAINSSNPNPQVYIRWGNIPDEKQHDFVGCSTQYCAINQVDINLGRGASGYWYIGLQAPNSFSNPYDFAIWHGCMLSLIHIY